MTLAERFQNIQSEIKQCCHEAGRDFKEVQLIAVSKTVDSEVIEEAYSIGIQDFGENRPDDLARKRTAFNSSDSTGPRWHFIGNIQSRKIRSIVQHADFVHSLYKRNHLPIIDKEASKLSKIQKLLVEVNASGEENKGGLKSSELISFLEESLSYKHVQICGLMTMAPQGDKKIARDCFESLADLRDEVQKHFIANPRLGEMHELSMGMSEDWREAIMAGATMIRIGRVIFDDAFMGS